MAFIAACFGVVTEHTLPLRKVSLVDRLHVNGSPAFYGSVVFRGSRPPGHNNRKRSLPFQLRFLNLLTTEKTAQEKEARK